MHAIVLGELTLRHDVFWHPTFAVGWHRNIKVLDMHLSEADLEDVFLSLVGKAS